MKKITIECCIKHGDTGVWKRVWMIRTTKMKCVNSPYLYLNGQEFHTIKKCLKSPQLALLYMIRTVRRFSYETNWNGVLKYILKNRYNQFKFKRVQYAKVDRWK